MKRIRSAPLALMAGLAVFVLLLLASTVAAESPSPQAGASAAPTAGPSASGSAAASPAAGGTPFATPQVPPCPNSTPGPTPSLAPGESPPPTRHPNLCPAQLSGGDPTALLAILFTPIFQAIFLGLAFVYHLVGDIGVAIIIVTVILRLIVWPLSRKQLVSSRRTQALAPELAEIRRKYKGDRQRQQQEQMRLYQERGINPLSGCVPTVISYALLLPMYYVFSSGLLAPDISSMLRVFGHQLIQITCQDPANALVPCIHTHIPWLGNIDASRPSVLFDLPIIPIGISALAIVSALLQVVASRMIMPPPTDDSGRAMQTTFLVLPLIFIFYGAILPAGLFIYYITTTILQLVQQYLTVGWGSLFPLFGWTPAFAVNHKPRFGVNLDLAPRPSGTTSTPPVRRDAADRAAGTIRPTRERGRTSRRGRRR